MFIARRELPELRQDSAPVVCPTGWFWVAFFTSRPRTLISLLPLNTGARGTLHTVVLHWITMVTAGFQLEPFFCVWEEAGI